MRFGKSTPSRGLARATAWACVLVLAAAWAAGCADNPNTTVLEPPGGQGGVIGRIVFQGATGTLPQARITPSIPGASPCSGFGAIAVLGTLNGFNTAEAENYAMRQIAACEWVIELELDEGELDVKLVTGPDINSVAFDNPGDYGNLAANNNDDPLEGTLDNPANGPDGNLSVTIPSAGLWTIYLNENLSPAAYRITQDVLIPLSDPVDGTFEIIGLPVGTISFVIEAEGYSPVTIPNVDVQKNQVTDLGDIVMEPITGALTGTIAYADSPADPPRALIEVRNANTLSLVDTVSTTGAFSVEGLATGTYLLWMRAEGYQNLRVRNVAYVNGQNTDIGTRTLSPGCGSDFLTIQLAGEFSGGFDLAVAPFMTEGPGCVWTDTLEVEPGNYNFKFVTNRAFDNDYGSDETTLNLPGTYAVEAGVSGEGTAINVEVAAAGEYIFTLDEENLEFTASFVGDIPSGSISGTVGFSDVSAPPLPAAVVRVLRAGTTTAVATTTTDPQTGDFLFEEIVEGTYDIEVSADGYLPQILSGRAVVVDQDTDLGSIVLQVAETTLHGTVSFSDGPSPLPEATVQVRNATTYAVVKSKTTTGAFSFEGLASGAYFLWIRADGYQNARVLDIAYVDGEDYDAGTVALDPGCGSEFLTVQLAGELTSWDLGQAPFMVEGPGCVWTDTVQVEPGTYNMKFVTDRAFDNPGDYGGDEVTVTLPGSYPVIGDVSGQGTAISVEVTTGGEYVFSLDEESLEFTALFLGDLPVGTIGGQVAFEGVAAAPYPVATVRLLRSGTGTALATTATTATDRSFRFTDVLEGTYDVRITAAGYLPLLIEDVQVVEDQDTPLGTRLLSVAVTSLHGSVAFSDAPDPAPEATVQVRNAVTYALVETATTTGGFSFEGLATGSYLLWIRADGYQNERVVDIDYVSGVDYDAGTTTLDPGCGSDFLTIQLAGELTSWNLPQAPFMIEGPGCVWTDTVDATAGTYYMKFVTERAFDNPRDYGGDESPLTLPGTFPVDPDASGQGSALRVVLPADGQWVFTLDEENVQFTAVILGAQIDGAITGQVAFAGVAGAPYPEATVSLFRTGETTALRSVVSDTLTGTFTFNTVADGTYDLSVSASCFTTGTRTGITVAGDTQDAGTVTLAEGGSSFTTIQIAGEFTSWTLAEAPFMTPGASCTWADTLTIAPGTYNFKFVTNGAFDNDYGGDQTEVVIPGTYAVEAGVSGEGTAIRVTVEAEATFVFTLDERNRQFSADVLTGAPEIRRRPSGN